MQRRTFIAAAGASILPLLGGDLALSTGKAMAAIPQAKLDRISIAGSVFKAHFDNWEYAIPTAKPRLSITQYPGFIREQFGVRHVELWQRQFFPDGLADGNFATVRAAADGVFATETGGKKTPMPFGVLLCNRRTAFRIQPARVYTASSNAWCKYFAPSAYA
jgi:hypothetical protein